MMIRRQPIVRSAPRPPAAGGSQWVFLVGAVTIAVALGYSLATDAFSQNPLLLGVPVWFLIAYRFPMVGIAVLSAGQFLLRAVVGGVADLSRSEIGGQTLLVGVILLAPLAVAAVVRGDLSRLTSGWRRQRLVLWPAALITAAVILSYLSSPSSYGQTKLVAYLGLNLPLLVLPLVLVRTPQDARQLVMAAIAVSLFTLAFSVVGTASVWQDTALRTRTVTTQLASEHVDIGTWFARRVAIGGLAAVAVLLVTRLRHSILVLVVAAALFGGVVLAASRSPVLGSLAALLVMVLLPGRAVRRRGARLAIILVLVVTGLVAIAYLPPQFTERYQDSLTLSNESLQRRFIAWEQSWELIKEEPITGVGLGHFPIALHGRDTVLYPHSLILEFAAELGIPMALLLLLMVGGGIRSGWQALRASRDQWVRALALWAIGVQVLSFIGAQSSGDLRTNEHVWLAVGVAAGAYFAAMKDLATRRATRPGPAPLESQSLVGAAQQAPRR
jgi:O-antigen ligase